MVVVAVVYKKRGIYMKKNILLFILMAILCCGCYSSTDDFSKDDVYLDTPYIKLIYLYERDYDIRYKAQVVYDENTNVMYLIGQKGNGMFMTPIYNTDGTLKLYTPEEE